MSINWETKVTTGRKAVSTSGKCVLCGYDRSYSHCTLTWCQYYQKAIDLRENSYSVDGNGYLIGQPQDAYVSACTSSSADYDVRLTTRYNTDDVENEMNVLHHVDARHSSRYSGLTDEQLANYLNWSGFIFESGFEHSSSLAYEMAFSYFMC